MTRDRVMQVGPSRASTMPLSSSPAKAPRLNQDPKRKGLVRAELVRLLYTNASLGIWATVVVTAIVSYLKGGIPHTAIQGWLLYTLAVSAARFTLVRRYFRSSIVQQFQVRIPIAELAYGGIVGVASLVDCVRHRASRWFEGPVGWVLRDAHPLPFIRARGQLYLFEPAEEVASEACRCPAARSEPW
jgi:hypothetical protein